MVETIHKFAWDEYSQNGEDGIIAQCLKRIKPKLKVAVEFGGADGYFCSNTALLRSLGWAVHMYDLRAVPGLVEAKMITPDNVNELPDCSVLSIDIDGNDFHIWHSYHGRPDIVIIEINSSIAPDVYHWSMDRGASFRTMNELAESKGYFLLCHTGNNVYLLNKHRHLFPDADGTFNASWL